MKFRIGPWVYRVTIMEDPIISDDGRELLGQAIYERREIHVSPNLPPEQRLDVLLHELHHCWEFHVPAPRTEEDRANLASMVTASAMNDLEMQGGVAALRKLSPPRIVYDDAPEEVEPDPDHVIVTVRRVPVAQIESGEAMAPSRAGRAQCGTCETIIADGSIVTSAPRFDFLALGNVCDRVLYCPHCGRLQKWVEGCSPRGIPNGAVVSEPEYAGGAEVDEFLAAHPLAVGMLC